MSQSDEVDSLQAAPLTMLRLTDSDITFPSINN
jgi:hypothetical protein